MTTFYTARFANGHVLTRASESGRTYSHAWVARGVNRKGGTVYGMARTGALANSAARAEAQGIAGATVEVVPATAHATKKDMLAAAAPATATTNAKERDVKKPTTKSKPAAKVPATKAAAKAAPATKSTKTVAAGKNAAALAAEYTNGRKAMLDAVLAGKGKALLADVLEAGRKAGAKAVRHTLRSMQTAGAVVVSK